MVKEKKFNIRLNIEPALHRNFQSYCAKRGVKLFEGGTEILREYLDSCKSKEFRNKQIAIVPNSPTRATEGTDERNYWLSSKLKSELNNVVKHFREDFGLPVNGFGNNSIFYKALYNKLNEKE